jgi:hypothetical protein
MRRIILTAIFLTGVLAVFASPPARASVSWSVSITSFHETLAPYGRWVVTRGYGEVWIPASIVVGWEPYSDGEWIWTDYGWTWVSYDPWGDAPCHYGTWVWVDPYGWVWLPGTIWAPAWVTWAWTDDYIGWAPVPATFVLASSGYSGPAVVAAPARYVFVPANQFVGVNVQAVRVPVSQNSVILSRSRKATHFSVSGGIVRATADPPLAFVQRVSGKRIERTSVDKLKARPSPISAAHISGKRIRVVAPASERSAAAAAQSNRKETVVQPGKQTRATSSTGKGHPKPSHEVRTSQARAAPSAGAATASPANGSKLRSHEKSVKTEPARPAGKPEKSIVQESRARPASRPKEERHAQPGEHTAKVPPPRESSREPAPTLAPQPQVQENPHAAPPPPVQAPKPAPPPPKEKGKEKGRD